VRQPGRCALPAGRAERSRRSGGRSAVPDPVAVAAAFIEAHYDRAIRLADLAAETGLSVSRIAHRFRQVRGVSPMQYAAQVRIGHARRLLETTTFELREVAEMTGFRSQAYFTRVFRRHVGMSPGQYRKRRKKAASRRSDAASGS